MRYDQLMNLGWVQFLPFALGFIIFLASVVYISDLGFIPEGRPTFPFLSENSYWDSRVSINSNPNDPERLGYLLDDLEEEVDWFRESTIKVVDQDLGYTYFLKVPGQYNGIDFYTFITSGYYKDEE